MFTADTPSASSAASTLVYSSLGHASTSSSGVDAAGVPPPLACTAPPISVWTPSSLTAGLAPLVPDPSAPSYYHYHFPTAMADLTSAYTVASCTGGGAQLCNDFLASGSTLVPSANSAFTPRGQQAPPRSKSAEPEPRFQEPAAEITVEEGSEKTDTSNLMEEND
ncbi:hypothetical protein BaRGS_00021475 [Batillaria attramentaria]|uniref:Uncharacterized protein n=1 Tax=Batillaria attramentaria TaxID=370345 RepID=A0ABD0KJJ9_9CAEN